MKTIKITLAFFAALQLNGQIKASETVDVSPIEMTEQESSKIFELFQISENMAKEFLIVFKNQFMDIKNYPEMSLLDLGQAAIDIINTTGDKLPNEIKTNLKTLISIKSSANSIAEIKANHVLISELLIQLIDFKLKCINNEIEIIKKHVKVEDIAVIKKALSNYKDSVIKLKKRNTYKNLSDVETDLKKIGKDLEPIWTNHPIYLAQIAQRNLTASTEEPSISTMEKMRIFNYRIAKNKK